MRKFSFVLLSRSQFSRLFLLEILKYRVRYCKTKYQFQAENIWNSAVAIIGIEYADKTHSFAMPLQLALSPSIKASNPPAVKNIVNSKFSLIHVSVDVSRVISVQTMTMNDNENPLNSLVLPILIRPILLQVNNEWEPIGATFKLKLSPTNCSSRSAMWWRHRHCVRL